MSRKVEDILGGDNPERDLQKEPQGWSRKMAAYLLRVLKGGKMERLDSPAREQLWARINQTANGDARRKLMIRRILFPSVAACAAVLFFVWWFVPRSNKHMQSPIAIAAQHNQTSSLDTGTVHLKGGNNRLVLLDDEDIVDLAALGSNGATEGAGGVFNTLTVPYGKRTEVVFPDGSKVWLNAGSQLTFPETFDSEKREVYLEGEGYFDVEGDRKRPFYVHTADMVVKVLGTTFNVSSYHDDPFASTVLLSGEIELQSVGETSFDTQILKPGTAAVLRKDSKHLTISTETVENYISWTRKQLILKNTPLTEILARLERVYNTDITVASTSGAHETFSGRLDLTQSLTSLLTTLYHPLEYQLQKDERGITIKKK